MFHDLNILNNKLKRHNTTGPQPEQALLVNARGPRLPGGFMEKISPPPGKIFARGIYLSGNKGVKLKLSILKEEGGWLKRKAGIAGD
jgi:hypothetical protein